jgi:hypothetical protein
LLHVPLLSLSPSLSFYSSVMHQGLRDPGSRQGSGRTLESPDSGPGFRGSGTAGGCSAQEVLQESRCSRVLRTKIGATCTDFDPWEFFENVELRGECEVEEAEQVQPLRRAVVGHRRSSHCTWALTQDGRSMRSMANLRRSTTRPIPFCGRSAQHDARGGREEGRQAARRDRSRSNRLRTRHSDRAAWTCSLLVRRIDPARQ